MKTNQYSFKKNLQQVLKSLIVLLILSLLCSCVGADANDDMMRSIASGDINREDHISARELKQILIAHFGDVKIMFSDPQYVLPDNGKVVQLSNLVHCGTNQGTTLKTTDWDCDDYAIAALVPLRNYAFGAMFVTTSNGIRHALNVFVNHKREVVYWEPQTCQYYRGQFYKPELILF